MFPIVMPTCTKADTQTCPFNDKSCRFSQQRPRARLVWRKRLLAWQDLSIGGRLCEPRG
jgi:hypothetical protein